MELYSTGSRWRWLRVPLHKDQWGSWEKTWRRGFSSRMSSTSRRGIECLCHVGATWGRSCLRSVTIPSGSVILVSGGYWHRSRLLTISPECRKMWTMYMHVLCANKTWWIISDPIYCSVLISAKPSMGERLYELHLSSAKGGGSWVHHDRLLLRVWHLLHIPTCCIVEEVILLRWTNGESLRAL